MSQSEFLRETASRSSLGNLSEAINIAADVMDALAWMDERDMKLHRVLGQWFCESKEEECDIRVAADTAKEALLAAYKRWGHRRISAANGL